MLVLHKQTQKHKHTHKCSSSLSITQTQTQTHSLLGQSIFRRWRSVSGCEMKEFNWKKINDWLRMSKCQSANHARTVVLHSIFLLLCLCVKWKSAIWNEHINLVKTDEMFPLALSLVDYQKFGRCGHLIVLKLQNIHQIYLRWDKKYVNVKKTKTHLFT